jgi:hypothetical protein
MGVDPFMENDIRLGEIRADVKRWFEALDRLNSELFVHVRGQIITPERRVFD